MFRSRKSTIDNLVYIKGGDDSFKKFLENNPIGSATGYVLSGVISCEILCTVFGNLSVDARQVLFLPPMVFLTAPSFVMVSGGLMLVGAEIGATLEDAIKSWWYKKRKNAQNSEKA